MISVLILISVFPAPDIHLTPGDVVPIEREQVCKPGYSGRARNVSLQTKRKVIQAYIQLDHRFEVCLKPGACEVDHLISLELGGSNDPKNLWPEPYCAIGDQGCLGARQKDVVENRLHRLVCEGKITLKEAQWRVSHEWEKEYSKASSPQTDRSLPKASLYSPLKD